MLKGREGDYDIIIMTYNSVPNLIDELKIFLKSNNVMFVCDEAHKIKNAEGIWANSVLKIASLAKSRVISQERHVLMVARICITYLSFFILIKI